MVADPARPSAVQLVFDTNILVDAILARGHYYPYAVQVLEMVRQGEVEGWYAPHTLTTVYYLVEKTLANEGQNRAQSTQAARAVVNKVLGLLKPLPQVGDEFLTLCPQPGDDLEDLLIVTLASRYLPSPLIVTRDKWMLMVDRPWQAAHPKDIVEAGGPPAWSAPRQDQPLAFIDLAAQQRILWPGVVERMHTVLRHGQYILGPEIAELEATLAEYVGVKHAITVASGTASLEIALRALGIGPGDEVITVPFTWISSAEVIGLVGATPVFVDIEPKSFTIDVAKIEAAITPRTQAILPVSLFGQMPDYAAINALAARHGLPVIEDAAQSFGATQHGQRSGGVTTLGSTSFFPAKPLGCYGDGGALFTDDDDLAERMRAIRTHGGIQRHHHPWLGMNGRFDTLQAAVLLAKLPHFTGEVEARSRIGARYTEQLQDVCATPCVLPGNTHVYAQYTIRLADRDRVGEALKAQSIPTAVYYPKCLHEQPVFAGLGYRWGDFPEAERASREVLSLPMHPWLTEPDQDRIISALSLCLKT